MVQSILNNQTSYKDYNGSIYMKQSNKLQRLQWFNLYETINQATTKTITQSNHLNLYKSIQNYVTFVNPRICTIVLEQHRIYTTDYSHAKYKTLNFSISNGSWRKYLGSGCGLSSGRDSEDLGKMRPFVQDRKRMEVDGARNLDLGIKRQRKKRPLVLVTWAFDWGDTQTEPPVKERSIFRSEEINFSPSWFRISISLSEWDWREDTDNFDDLLSQSRADTLPHGTSPKSLILGPFHSISFLFDLFSTHTS